MPIDEKMFKELYRPFDPQHISWKPGKVTKDKSRCLVLVYADLRAYMNRLDEVCGTDWSVAYEPWGNDRIICRLTIMDVTRSSTGEMAKQDQTNEMGGTVAEAQAFKRAAAMFGLGRYLYTMPSGWVDFAEGAISAQARNNLQRQYEQYYKRAVGVSASNLDQLVKEEFAPLDQEEPEPAKKVNPFDDDSLPAITDDQHAEAESLLAGLYPTDQIDHHARRWAEWASRLRTTPVVSLSQLTKEEASTAITALYARLAKQNRQPTVNGK